MHGPVYVVFSAGQVPGLIGVVSVGRDDVEGVVIDAAMTIGTGNWHERSHGLGQRTGGGRHS